MRALRVNDLVVPSSDFTPPVTREIREFDESKLAGALKEAYVFPWKL